MGDTVSFTYASLFPTQVDLVCAIDAFRPSPLPKIALFLTMEHMKKAYVSNNGSGQREREYTYDQIKKFMSGTSVDPSKVVYLLKRGIKASKRNPNLFQFTRDIRVNYTHPFTMEHKNSLYYMKKIRAAYLFIKSGIIKTAIFIKTHIIYQIYLLKQMIQPMKKSHNYSTRPLTHLKNTILVSK